MTGWLIFGGVCLVLLALLLCSATLLVSYETEKFSVTLRFLFLRFPLLPAGEKSEKKGKNQPKNGKKKPQKQAANEMKPQEESPEKGNKDRVDFSKTTVLEKQTKGSENSFAAEKKSEKQPSNIVSGEKKKLAGNENKRGFFETLGLIATILRHLNGPLLRLCHRIRVDRLRFAATVSGEDAADTAIRYGNFFVIWNNLLAFFAGIFRLMPAQPAVTADYQREEKKTEISGSFRLRASLWTILAFLFCGGGRVLFAVLRAKPEQQ